MEYFSVTEEHLQKSKLVFQERAPLVFVGCKIHCMLLYMQTVPGLGNALWEISSLTDFLLLWFLICTCTCKQRSSAAQRAAVLLRVWLLGLGYWRPYLHPFQRWPLFVLSFQCKSCLFIQLFYFTVSISFTSSWHRYFSNGHIAKAHTSHLQAQEEPVLFKTTLISVAIVQLM